MSIKIPKSSSNNKIKFNKTESEFKEANECESFNYQNYTEVAQGNTITWAEENEFIQKCKRHKLSDFNLNSKGRRDWCFTYFPDTDENKKNFVKNIDFLKDNQIKYIRLGREICPKSKKLHYQSYIYFHNNKTFSAVKKYFFKIFNKYVHFEPCKGSIDENIAYCGKDEQFIEHGTMPAQGERTDLDEIKNQLINSKTTVDEITINFPNIYHIYGRTLEKIELLVLRGRYRKWMTTCDYYYGPTSTGKSEKAFKDFSPDTHYKYNLYDNMFWNGYIGQETVIINEFRGQIPLGELLELIDKYPHSVKIKGKETVPFLAKHIIITSSLHPKEIYTKLNKNDNINHYSIMYLLLHQSQRTEVRMESVDAQRKS